MEARLGESFETVRLHVDARSTEALNARAYTVGEEIVVHPGFADLRSRQGEKLLAHELAHVIQQRRGPVDGTPAPGGIRISDPSDRFERAAEATAHAASLAPRSTPVEPAPGAGRSDSGSGPSSQAMPAVSHGPHGSARATAPYVQRAIVAIDGDTDEEPSKQATRACLWNLQHVKSSNTFNDGAARGKVAGPDVRKNLPDLRGLLAQPGESLYVLAHGSRWEPSIGGMSPRRMARWLRRVFAGEDFTGKIKLVSCHSGADRSNRRSTDRAKGRDSGAYRFKRSYAQELARRLQPTGDDDRFRPSSVQGVVGVGWVDEFTGSITGIDKEKYDSAMKQFATNSDVGSTTTATGGDDKKNPFTEISDSNTRGLALRALFGTPVDVAVVKPRYARKHVTLHTGKGKWGKRTFQVGSGTEL